MIWSAPPVLASWAGRAAGQPVGAGGEVGSAAPTGGAGRVVGGGGGSGGGGGAVVVATAVVVVVVVATVVVVGGAVVAATGGTLLGDRRPERTAWRGGCVTGEEKAKADTVLTRVTDQGHGQSTGQSVASHQSHRS